MLCGFFISISIDAVYGPKITIFGTLQPSYGPTTAVLWHVAAEVLRAEFC
jgi:hypothetical protein